MKITIISAVGLFILIFFIGCGPTPNKKMELELGGPCDECPTARLDTIFENVEGIADYDFNNELRMLVVNIDSNMVKPQEIINLLNRNGYDVDLDLSINYKFWCCRREAIILPEMEEDEEVALIEELDEESNLSFDGEMNLGLDELDLDLDEEMSNDELDDELLFDESDLEAEFENIEMIPKNKKKKK